MWALVLQREFLLPEYTLLAFGNMAEGVRCVLASDTERANICGTIRMAGGVRTDSGYFMELSKSRGRQRRKHPSATRIEGFPERCNWNDPLPARNADYLP